MPSNMLERGMRNRIRFTSVSTISLIAFLPECFFLGLAESVSGWCKHGISNISRKSNHGGTNRVNATAPPNDLQPIQAPWEML